MTLTNPNGSRATVPFQLCQSAGLKICDSCTRNDERHPIAALNPNQARMPAPASDSGRCPSWRG
jgi:hypothetical protein